MASNASEQQQLQQQQQQLQHVTDFQCLECGRQFNSKASVDVHYTYHHNKSNLTTETWNTTMQSMSVAGSQLPSAEETNNNTKVNIKRELIPTNSNSTVSPNSCSDNLSNSKNNNSPSTADDYNSGSRVTPEMILGQPLTPPDYQQGPAPYQNTNNHHHHQEISSSGSGGGQNFSPYQQTVKQEQISPTTPYHQGIFTIPNSNNYTSADPHQQYNFNLDQNQQYPGTVESSHKLGRSAFRYHPYHQQPAHSHQQQQQHQQQPPYHDPAARATSSHQQVPSSTSPVIAFPPQPTPSPSPKHCDKCGLVCENAQQLATHINQCHPPSNYFIFDNNQHQMHVKAETEDVAQQSEILDLDSHKVHQVYSEEEKRQQQNGAMNGGGHTNPHSVNSLLWSGAGGAAPNQHQPKLYGQTAQERMFMNSPQLHQMHPSPGADFMSSNTAANHQDGTTNNSGLIPNFRSTFAEHLPSSASNPSVVSSSQIVVAPNQPAAANSPASNGKSANWKSNEARRPKTYNCTACNKWFTSSGHLKRHYNTTLHKNAVKSNGGPDPATLPISQHHHPARESSSNKEDSNNSPGEQDESNSMPPMPTPTMLQQPPSSPYDRQPPPPNIIPLHSPMAHHNPLGAGMAPSTNLTSLSNGSPPNGEAGLSPTHNLDTRGLLSLNTTSSSNTTSTPHHQQHHLHHHHHGFGMMPPSPLHHPHMMSSPLTHTPTMVESHVTHQQFQMYPNGSAPHVTQITDIIKASGNNSSDESSSLVIDEAVDDQQHQEEEQLEEQEMLLIDLQQPQQQTVDIVVVPPNEVDQRHQQEPLPSFDELQTGRYNGSIAAVTAGYDNMINVGGKESVTAPYSYFMENLANAGVNGALDHRGIQMMYKVHENAFDTYTKYTILSEMADAAPPSQELIVSQFSTTPLDQGTADTTIITTAADIINDSSVTTTHTTTTTVIVPPAFGSTNGGTLLRGSPTPSKSPEGAHIKTDYEEMLPVTVTSTVSAFKCDDCDKVFNRPCYLTQHNQTCHSGEKPHKCNRCGKRFSSDEAHHRHLQKHAGDKPHKCDQCPKQFNHKTDLRRHMCLHTGQKPFTCETCRKGFIRKDHMIKHYQTHYKKAARPNGGTINNNNNNDNNWTAANIVGSTHLALTTNNNQLRLEQPVV